MRLRLFESIVMWFGVVLKWFGWFCVFWEVSTDPTVCYGV